MTRQYSIKYAVSKRFSALLHGGSSAILLSNRFHALKLIVA